MDWTWQPADIFLVGCLRTLSLSRLYNVRWWGDWWIWKNLEGSGRGVSWVLSKHLPGMTEKEKTLKVSVRTAGVPASRHQNYIQYIVSLECRIIYTSTLLSGISHKKGTRGNEKFLRNLSVLLKDCMLINPEDQNLNMYCHANPKSYTVCWILLVGITVIHCCQEPSQCVSQTHAHTQTYWLAVLLFISIKNFFSGGHAVAQLVEALCAGSIPDEVIGFFNWPNPSNRTMALESTQLLTEMRSRNLPKGKERPAREADALTAICEPIV
jgi:hypothetical protein